MEKWKNGKINEIYVYIYIYEWETTKGIRSTTNRKRYQDGPCSEWATYRMGYDVLGSIFTMIFLLQSWEGKRDREKQKRWHTHPWKKKKKKKKGTWYENLREKETKKDKSSNKKRLTRISVCTHLTRAWTVKNTNKKNRNRPARGCCK